MWLLGSEPGSFASTTVLLATEMPLQLPMLSKMNYIHVLYILIIIHLKQKFEAVYLRVYVSLI